MDANKALSVTEIPRMYIQWDWKEALRCLLLRYKLLDSNVSEQLCNAMQCNAS